MPPITTNPALDPRRADLASFENAYAVAIRLRERTGLDQFIIRTGNPMQPVRVTTRRPANTETTLAMVA